MTDTVPSPTLAEAFLAGTAHLSEPDRAAVAARLSSEAVRRATAQRCPTPGDLARYCDPTIVQTPALELVDKALMWAFRTPGARLVISMGSQIGKSLKVTTWFPLWCLQRDPDLRIIAASYGLELIQSHNRTTRNLVLTYGSGAVDSLTGNPLPDKLGYTTARDKAAANNWRVEGYTGGMYVAGVGGSLTGIAADLGILDDPYSGLTDASSPAIRRQVWDWWTGTFLARLSPTAPAIIISTRWHEKDLMGELIRRDVEAAGRGETPVWRVVNIPAIAAEGVPDSLGRPTSGPGRYLVTPRGHTPQQWEQRRKEVGERTWQAVYQGDPRPAGSTVFEQEWWNASRIAAEPPILSRMVSVDPAETGEGDEAGIIGLGLATDGRVVVTHDRSGLMRSDGWSRAAVLLAIETGARWLVYEAYVSGHTYRDTLKTAWTRIREQARMLAKTKGDVEAAATRILRDTDGPSAALGRDKLTEELTEVAAIPSECFPPGILASTRPPFQLVPHRGPARAGKRQRAAGAAQAAETGRLVMLGSHPELEGQSTSWYVTDSDSPDRMDALANGFNELTTRGGHTVRAVAPAARKQIAPAAGSTDGDTPPTTPQPRRVIPRSRVRIGVPR